MTETTSEPESVTDEPDRAHLDIEEGAGCTEVWEHLSEKREAEESS